MPPAKLALLSFLVRHLQRVAKRRAVNKMGYSELAAIWQPVFVRPPGLQSNSTNSEQQQQQRQQRLLHSVDANGDPIIAAETGVGGAAGAGDGAMVSSTGAIVDDYDHAPYYEQVGGADIRCI